MAHQKLRRSSRNDILIDGPQALGERRSSQSNDLHIGIVLDVFDGLAPSDMALIDNQEIKLWKIFPALQGLSRADLQKLLGCVSPMPRLENAMIQVIPPKPLACLLDQDDSI